MNNTARITMLDGECHELERFTVIEIVNENGEAVYDIRLTNDGMMHIQANSRVEMDNVLYNSKFKVLPIGPNRIMVGREKFDDLVFE